MTELRNAMEMCVSLNVGEPTINLHTCALHELQRIPKLSQDNQNDLIRLRLAHAQAIRNWADVRKPKGIGPSSMMQLLVFCKDPETTSLADPEPNNELTPGDLMELLEMHSVFCHPIGFL